MRMILLCCLLACANNARSQKFTSEIVDEDKYGYEDSMSRIRGGFLQYQVKFKEPVVYPFGGWNNISAAVKVNKLDESLQLIKSSDFMKGERKLLPGLYNFIKFNNQHCIIYQDAQNNNQLGSLKLAVIDEGSLDVKTEITLIDHVKYKTSFEAKDVLKDGFKPYSIQVSKSEQMLLSISEPKTPEGNKKQILISVFNKQLNQVMERKIVFKEDWAIIDSYVCDDNGNVFIGYKWGIEGRKLKRGDLLEDRFKVMIITPQNPQPKVLPVKIPELTPYSLFLQHSVPQNRVFILGHYMEGWDEPYLGVYHATIDPATLAMTAPQKTAFPEDLLKKIDGDGYAWHKGKMFGLNDGFRPRPVIRDDGTVDLLLTYTKAERKVSPGTNVISYNHYAGSFVDAHLVNGKFIFTRIPRDMSNAGGFTLLDYSTFSKDGNLTLLYNESEINIKKDIEDKARFSVVQKSEVCASTISKDGQAKRVRLLTEEDGKTIGLLDRVTVISPEAFLIQLMKQNFASMHSNKVKYAKIFVE